MDHIKWLFGITQVLNKELNELAMNYYETDMQIYIFCCIYHYVIN